MSNSLKMDDNSIAMIAKLLQVALLTGTDIVDNLRTMRFELGDGDLLLPTAEFVENFDKNLQRMAEEVRFNTVE
jgi:hypothetical protein